MQHMDSKISFQLKVSVEIRVLRQGLLQLRSKFTPVQQHGANLYQLVVPLTPQQECDLISEESSQL